MRPPHEDCHTPIRAEIGRDTKCMAYSRPVTQTCRVSQSQSLNATLYGSHLTTPPTHRNIIPASTTSSRPFATELACPLCALLQIRLTDRGSARLDGLDEILVVQRRLLQLLRLDLRPAHLDGALIAWTAWRELRDPIHHHPLVVRRRLDLAHRLHERILHRDADVAARVPLGELGQLAVVPLLELTRGVADADLEHLGARVRVRQVDVHAPLEAAADRPVKLPGDVGRAEDEDALSVFADAVHLDEQLRFDAAGGLRLAFAARAAQRVDLVDEDDGRLVLARHREELFDESAGSGSVGCAEHGEVAGRTVRTRPSTC